MKKLIGLTWRFLVVGALSTVIEVGVFNLLYLVFGMDLTLAKVIASLVALVNAYLGNREWAFRFRDRRHRLVELSLFLAVNLACTVIGAALLSFGTWALGDPGPLVVNVINLASIAIVVLVRFVLYHFVVFRGPSTRLDPAVEDQATRS